MPDIGMELIPTTKLYRLRWLVAFTAIVQGCQVGIISVTWGTWHQFLIDYFHVTEIGADNVNLSSSIGSIIVAIPIVLIVQKFSQHVKPWLQFGLGLMGITLLMEGIILATTEQIYFLVLVQFVGGISQALFFVSMQLLATAWFGEKEQATSIGLSFFSFSLGKLLGTALPSVIQLTDPQAAKTLSGQAHALITMLSAASSVDIVLVLIITSFLPNIPPIPPSMAEAQRLTINKNSISTSVREHFRTLLLEMKVLLLDKTAAFLVIVQTTFITMSIVQFILMPVPESVIAKYNLTEMKNGSSTINRDPLTLPKSYVLMAFAFGGLIGSVSAGLVTDKFKKYNPFAQILCSGILLCSILILVGYRCDIFDLQIVSSAFYGVFSFGANCFFVEIIKQYVFPRVKEITYGTVVAMFVGIWILIYVPVLRQIHIHFGSIGYLIAYCIILLICQILAAFINPKLNRFEYDSDQLQLIRNDNRLSNIVQ